MACMHHDDNSSTLPAGLCLVAFFLGVIWGSYIREGDMALACDEAGRYTLKGERYACRRMGEE